ncbi:MAG: winged helix-turn-helix domain-containing protein, partial [Rhizomicrobium sp.]
MLDTLRELGDSGRAKEVTEKVATRLHLSEEELDRTNKNGQSHFANAVAWARFYLAKAGLILLRHIISGLVRVIFRAQQGHLGKVLASATIRRCRSVAIEF